MFEFLRPLLAFFRPSLRLQQRQDILRRDLVRLVQDLEKVIEAILTEKVRFLEKLDALDGGSSIAGPAKTAEAGRRKVVRPGMRAAAKEGPTPEQVAAAKALRARTAALEARCHSAFAELADEAAKHRSEIDRLSARLSAACAADLADDLPQNLEEVAQKMSVQKSAVSELRLKAIATTTELHQACTKGANSASATPNVAGKAA